MREDNFKAIFKAYDIRGRVGTELTAETARSIGQALASWLPNDGPIAVGQDMRPDSAELSSALIEGVLSQGRDVIDIGQVTSDMIYFAVGNMKLAGGAMITASHNPGEYNGIKLCREEARPIGEDSGLLDVRDMAIGDNFTDADQKGTITNKDIDEDWIKHALSFIDASQLKPLHIAVDAGNGMAGKIFPKIESFVPWTVEEMYFELDGTFPNHEANPLKFETLADMIAKIKTENLDGGIAFDGDGDRAFLVDETGTVLTGNIMNGILSDYFLTLFPGANILYDLRSSHSVPETITAKGGTPIRTRVGHSFIKKIMRESNAPFGGEVSGHFYFRDNFFADSGLIAAVIGLYAAGLTGKSLSQLRADYTKYATADETNFKVADKDSVISKLKSTFADAKQDELDGLTVELGDGSWFNVRGSNTEPVLRLNAEASTNEELDALVAKVESIINS